LEVPPVPELYLSASDAETLARLLEAVLPVARGRRLGYPCAFVDKEAVVTGLAAWVDRFAALGEGPVNELIAKLRGMG
jgi:hypothetical protein